MRQELGARKMRKRVLDIGNCGPDHASLKRFFQQNFAAELLQADALRDAREILSREEVDLIVVNRKLDSDYSDGLDVIKGLQAEPQFASIPMMLITNYPEHQKAAMEAGALEGFGKLQLADKTVIERVGTALKG